MSSPPSLLIVGASVRAATASAVRGGFQVVAADLFADTDLQQIAECHRVAPYPDGITLVRARHATLPMVYTGAIENHPQVLSACEKLGPLFGNSAAVVRRVRDPQLLQETLRENGFGAAAVSLSKPVRTSHGWLEKPLRSAGGYQIRTLTEADYVRTTTEVLPREGPRGLCYYQELIEGPVCAAAFVAVEGRAAWLGVTDMLVGQDWTGARGYIYCGSLTRASTTAEAQQWSELGNLLADQFQLVGLFGVDAVVQQDRIVVLEVNPRYTASMEVLEPTSGPSHLQLHVAACRDRSLPSPENAIQHQHPGRDEYRGKVVLYARDAGICPKLRVPPRVHLADCPEVGSPFSQGEPVVTLLASATSRPQIEATLRAAAHEIQGQLRPTD